MPKKGSLAIHPKKGHHRGIRRAIELPYRALINTFLVIVIPCLLIYVGYNVEDIIFYVKLIFVATLVTYFNSLSTIFWFLSNIHWLCTVFWSFV